MGKSLRALGHSGYEGGGALPSRETSHSPSHGASAARGGAEERRRNSPVHAGDRVRLAMAAAVLVSHVDREGGVERRQEARRHCAGETETGLQKRFPSRGTQCSKGFKAR